jgi:hypothetical protein
MINKAVIMMVSKLMMNIYSLFSSKYAIKPAATIIGKLTSNILKPLSILKGMYSSMLSSLALKKLNPKYLLKITFEK